MDQTKIRVRLNLMKRFFCLCSITLLFSVLLVPSQVFADQDEERARLEKIRKSIAELKKELESTRSSREKLLKSLEKSEKDIGDLSKKAKKIKGELNQTQGKLNNLRKERTNLGEQKKSQQKHVASYINSAYRVGNQGGLRMLLNQKDPAAVSRNMKYFDFLAAARAQKIESFVSTIARLDKIEPEIEYQSGQLKKQHRSLEDQKKSMRNAQAKRKSTLNGLNSDLSNKGKELNNLEKDRGRLQKLLTKVKQIAKVEKWTDVVEPGEPSTKPFAKSKGLLPWPTTGRVVKHYGANRVANKLRWEGMLIKSPSGSPVKAVHRGRVVFSDYLRGHGLLIIVDHGGGYMTLYAHNQTLYKELGEWVDAGDTISAVGNSGGRQESGLYFELRVGGKPTNPRAWFRKA